MSNVPFHSGWVATQGGERLFDSTPTLAQAPLPAPLIYATDEAALRRRELAFAAKRLVDMAFVTGLGWEEAMHRFVWRGFLPPGGLATRRDGSARQAALKAAFAAGDIRVTPDIEDRRVRLIWNDPTLGAPTEGHAIAPPGWGGVVLGTQAEPGFTPHAIARKTPSPDRAWPLGDGVAEPAAAPDLAAAVARLFERSPGAYGILVGSPDAVLFEAYGKGGAADRVTPSWSVNKSMTGSLIGRLIQQGWLEDVNAPAPAPLWRHPNGIHALITLDHLLHMRSGLGLPMLAGDGTTDTGFENTAVYTDGEDGFAAAQRQMVATRPGSVFRYVNSGINVLGAIIRDRIEQRGLPYPETLYALLPDRLGMTSYTLSADWAGNLVASGSAFATLRDYAKLGVLYLNDGVWDGERLLPKGWVDYALAPTHAGTSYAGTFWTNADRSFPALPPDAAWMSGAGDQRVFVLRGANRVVAVANETDRPMDLAALNDVLRVVVGG